MINKYVYLFGDNKAQGNGSMKALLGGKGANLAEMTRIGLRVPPGYTITTEVCNYFYENDKTYPNDYEKSMEDGIAFIENILGKKFGDHKSPLLLSVRSGARDSMPGMMDTILNLGLNDITVEGLSNISNNPRFAWDCYRRFVQMYGDVVLGVQKLPNEDHDPFEAIIENLKRELFPGENYVDDTQLDVAALKELVSRFKQLIKERTDEDFPMDPWEQLKGAVGAVFGSWMNDRAIVYRRKYNIPHEWGTAVNVQAMVYGNTGDNSGSGVMFTRDPATGEKVLYGEFLMNAQGEDVVAGIRTPIPVKKLIDILPKAYKEIESNRQILEKHFKDLQDCEFTIEDGKVYMLQTRNGKRSGLAALRIAIEMEEEGLIDWRTAIKRVPANQLEQVLTPVFDQNEVKKVQCLAKGLPAGPGAASGKIYFNAESVVEATNKGEKVLLVRSETSPDDLRGMIAAEGILTSRGGVSSHAALVARQMGKVCVCGADSLQIDNTAKTVNINGSVYKEGDYFSINGNTGEVFGGEVNTISSEIVRVLIEKTLSDDNSKTFKYFKKLMKWCSSVTQLKVRTNADTPEQTLHAVAFGAEGIGLCRTEHMFFEENRIDIMREMILSDNAIERKSALAKLLPFQKQDFIGIFKALNGYPATVRFLDPPLHEFLPHEKSAKEELAVKMEVPLWKVEQRIKELQEFNPMLGLRGCRLGVIYPEISEMQARAIFEAAVEVQKEGINCNPEIMIPLVGYKKELDHQIEVVNRVAKEVMNEHKATINFLVGTMIEVPRAALTANEIAQSADFFSFGTNDLTQTCLAMSRDDSGSFSPVYSELEIIKNNPFITLDMDGVGELIKIAVTKAKRTKQYIKLGICGEQGGDPDTITFCHKLGFHYVSCSPFRVPVARLAAAQAALEDEAKEVEKKEISDNALIFI